MPSCWDDFTNLSEDFVDGETEPIIYRYHSPSRPRLMFYTNEKSSEKAEKELYFGIELEFDTRSSSVGSRGNKIDLINKSNNIFDTNKYIYYMNDGSLSHGLEMITQPSTYEFLISEKDKISECLENIKNHNFKSQTFRSCGLHIHFNSDFFYKNHNQYVENLLYLVDKFWKELVIVSRRYYPNIIRWANKYDEKPCEIVENMKRGYLPTRYHAVNLRNANTIEFRLFRGTLDINTLYNTIEIVKNLITLSKNDDVEVIQHITIDDIFNTKELKAFEKKCLTKTMKKQIENL